MTTTSFLDYYRGTLSGIMNLEGYQNLAQAVQAERWFALDFSQEQLEIQEFSPEEVSEKLASLHAVTRAKKLISGEFPFTYVKDRENPRFIKTYDPQKCGDSCSITTPPPWWVFSTVKPSEDELSQLRAPVRGGQHGLFQRLKKAFA